MLEIRPDGRIKVGRDGMTKAPLASDLFALNFGESDWYDLLGQSEVEKKVAAWGSGGAIFGVITSSIASELLADQSTAIRLAAVFAYGGILAGAWVAIARAIILRRAKDDGRDN